MKRAIIFALASLALVACAEGRQRHLESRKLDSGVTSDNGGGQSVLHNNPNVGLTNNGTVELGTRNKTAQPQ